MKMNKLVKGLLVGFIALQMVGCEEAKEVENIEVQDTKPVVKEVENEYCDNCGDRLDYCECTEEVEEPVVEEVDVVEGYIIDHKLSLGENVDLCLAGLDEDKEALFYEIVDYPIDCINTYTQTYTMQQIQKMMCDIYLDKCPLVVTNRLSKDEVKLALMKGLWHMIPTGNTEGNIQDKADLWKYYEINVYSLYDDILEVNNMHCEPFDFPTRNMDVDFEEAPTAMTAEEFANAKCENCGHDVSDVIDNAGGYWCEACDYVK